MTLFWEALKNTNSFLADVFAILHWIFYYSVPQCQCLVHCLALHWHFLWVKVFDYLNCQHHLPMLRHTEGSRRKCYLRRVAAGDNTRFDEMRADVCTTGFLELTVCLGHLWSFNISSSKLGMVVLRTIGMLVDGFFASLISILLHSAIIDMDI